MALEGGIKLKALLEEIKKKASNTQLKIGILEGATSSDGESLAARAASNEFGDGVPPRPFMRNTSRAHGKDWSNMVAHLLSGQNWDFTAALTVVGDIASKDMQNMIQKYPKAPPNAPSTIAIKKEGGYNPFDQPLVHTGDMLRAVSFEVDE